MKKKIISKNTTIIIIVAVVVLIGFGYFLFKNLTPSSPDTITLNEGTQTRFESLSIGLANVSNNSATLSFRKGSTDESTNKQVTTGDKFSIDGYNIEIISVKEVSNPSILPGSSHGTVKIKINK